MPRQGPCAGPKKSGAARGPPRWETIECLRSVRNRCPRVRRISRVLLDAANEVERRVERLIVLRVRRDVGLRAGLLLTFALEMATQRGLAASVSPRLELLRNLLQHLDIRCDALGLDRAAGRRKVARRGEPQRTIAGAKRDDGLYRALAERAGADDGRALVILQRARHD